MDRTSLVNAALAIEGAFPVIAALLLAFNATLDFKVPSVGTGA